MQEFSGESEVRLPKLRPVVKKGRVLYVRPRFSPMKTLLFRVGLIFSLIAFVIIVFWIDREGLRDHIDGYVSFTDILYFGMITVTTVGYGDIAPVSDSARLIDAFAVTPIRLFIWFIFLGTTYEFIVQKIIEDYRMTQIQKDLSSHVILCGFGHSGHIAAQEIVSKKDPADKIVAIDVREERVKLAAEQGYIGLHGDATSEELLHKAGIDDAKAAIVSMGRDDTTILVILTVRHLAPKLKIVANIKQEENIKLAKLSGADIVISPFQIGGFLLANAVETQHATTFLSDLMSVGGHMEINERKAMAGDIGKTMADIKSCAIMHIYTADGHHVGFSQRNSYKIAEGDTLLMIDPV